MRVSLLTFFVGGLLFLGISASAAVVPNDPLYADQWYLQKIHAPEAWETTIGLRDVVVAVIDSGVMVDHEDLVDTLWVNNGEIPDNGIDDDHNGYVDDRMGWDFLTNTGTPNPKFENEEEGNAHPLNFNHGTLVAGLIAASQNNALGMSGVAPHVRIMALRALTSGGKGEMQRVVAAIDYAVANGASVINLSFESSIRSALLTQALRRAYVKGIVVVSAAGNDSATGSGVDLDIHPRYPACARGDDGVRYVIGVAATDRNDAKTLFSHFGSRCVDIAAPGTDILSTVVTSPRFNLLSLYATQWSGTSFATALVSGAAALARSVDPTLSPDAVRAFLREGADTLASADPVYGGRVGTGRLNIARSIALLQSSPDRERILALAKQKTSKSALLAVAHMDGREPVRTMMLRIDGTHMREWFPFSSSYRKEINLIARDVNGDDHDEIIVSGGQGGGPHVRIFTALGDLFGQFFAFEPSYRGGISVDIGDPNPDGKKEIVVSPTGERQNEVRIFSNSGEQELTLSPFTDAWLYGSEVRVGDVDGDGIDDLVFATKRSAKPVVRVTNVFGEEKFSFFAYDEDVGPLSLALADTDGDGAQEIITARGRGVPEVRVWKKDVRASTFLAYVSSFRGGVVISSGDTNGDGRDEIIAVPRSNGGPHVKIFSSDGTLMRQFFTREKSWRGGMAVAFVRE
ncbi:MAG: S8 family peptidase [bacterium]|nr:S8 family peptidase [bacterium]